MFSFEYMGTKRVLATAMTRAEYNAYRGWELPSDENGEDNGFLVEYLDGGESNHPKHKGYISWSPKAQFQNAYEPTNRMSFSHALEAMYAGEKVARQGWNGKGMWVCLEQGNKLLPVQHLWNKHTKAFAEASGGYVDVLPYFIMKMADGKILMGWLASQSDMVADDWVLLPS